MAIRNIRVEGDSVLTKVAKPVTEVNEKTIELIEDMLDTMYDAYGVGLAAPQVGILRKVVVIDVGDENGKIELINPVIVSMKGKQRDLEGCLSVPDLWGYVVRPEKVKVKALNRLGKEFEIEGEGLLARALCHEVDHLSGVMFIDKAEELVTGDQLEDKK